MKLRLPTILRIGILALLIVFLLRPDWFEPIFRPLTQNNAPVIYNQGSLLTLTLLHLRTVAIATAGATIVAVALAILVTPALVLLGTALALMTEAGRSGIFNPGIHGFSEVLYAVSSAANNNGSAFAGLSANSPFWNCLLAFCMFVGRFGVIVPVMAIAGSLVNKKIQPTTTGTLPTHGALFIGLLTGTVLLVNNWPCSNRR